MFGRGLTTFTRQSVCGACSQWIHRIVLASVRQVLDYDWSLLIKNVSLQLYLMEAINFENIHGIEVSNQKTYEQE